MPSHANGNNADTSSRARRLAGTLDFEEYAAAEREILRRRGVSLDTVHLRATFNKFDADHSGRCRVSRTPRTSTWEYRNDTAIDGHPIQ